MTVEPARLQLEQIARKAIEAVQKERAQHLTRLAELDREQQMYADVLKAIGVEYHWGEQDHNLNARGEV